MNYNVDVCHTKALSFKVDERTIAALSYGSDDAPVVLALHGWLDNAMTFQQVAMELEGVRLICLDFAGHGYSDHRAVGHPYYIWENVFDVAAVVDQLQLNEQKIVIMGHSMGASVAMMFASLFPEKVDQLLLVEGLAPLVYPEEELVSLMRGAYSHRKRKEKSAEHPGYDSFEEAVKARSAGRWPVSSQASAWLCERNLRQVKGRWYWCFDRALQLPSLLRFSETQVAAIIAEVAAEVTLLLGDKGIEDQLMRDRISKFKHISVYTLEGNHHLHLDEQPARWIAQRLHKILGLNGR